MNTLSRRSFLAASAIAATGSLRPPLAFAEEVAKFKLGIVTYNVPKDWDLPTLLKVCKEVGVAAIECRTTHKHGVEPSLSPQRRKEVRQQFADAGIEIWGCGTVCEFHSPDQAVVRRNIETCQQFVQLVADLGGRGVKVRPNALPKSVPVARTLEQIGRSLTVCGKAADGAGVEIWVEVHGNGTAHPPHMRTIMEAANHRQVGVTWNSNATDVVKGSVAQYFKLLRPWIKSCHINELHSGYPYRELFRLLRETGYDRVTLAEIQGMPDAASGERLMRYYRALWTELNRD